jgi:EAL domain-containing protein (putative c-di-GMP-specific phosphodiesterase class I)
VRPEWFALEVSERSLESGDETVGDNLAAVAAAGVTISLDDFGTSLASLPRLVDLGVRRAKLQRSLVAAMVDDPRVDHIVASLLSLATALGLDTVAGGVESDATVRRLRELGCRSAQGYLFSPAIPEIELSSVLRDLATTAR